MEEIFRYLVGVILVYIFYIAVWRNPLNLFRGAEYQRFQKATKKEPLTYYDMNLSAQDHQTFFTCEADAGMYMFLFLCDKWLLKK